MFTVDGIIVVSYFGCRAAFADFEHLTTSLITTSHQLRSASVKMLSDMYVARTP